MHVLTADQFSHEQLDVLFRDADHMREMRAEPEGQRALIQRHVGQGVCMLFYEPSTRTRTSFGLAARYVGAEVDPTENAKDFSSAIKGETIEDTARTVAGCEAKAIILRHHETGGAARAAAAIDRFRPEIPKSIINAGDGKGEHPTQALLDAYTIKKDQGHLDNLHIVVGGDLLRGRTARSLTKLLATYEGNRFTFVSTPELQMGDDIKAHVLAHGGAYEETDEMMDAFKDADVVYWTRLQKERAETQAATPAGLIVEPAGDGFMVRLAPTVGSEQSRLTIEPHGNGYLLQLAGEQAPEQNGHQAAAFIIDQAALDVMPEHTTLMHPLPRVDEISVEVDSDPRAKYFDQVANGLYVRMALLDQVLSEAS